MRKAICVLTLLLILTSCGKEEASRQITSLETENTALEEQIAALETVNTALEKQNADLLGKLEKLQSSDPDTNPIDSFYKVMDTDGSTVSMNIVAGSWAGAWEAEARNLAEELKVQLPLREDQDLVDDYICAVEEQIERMDVMAIYPISDLSVPYPERIGSSGTLRGIMWAGSRREIWKDAFFQLLYVLPDGPDYTYIFDSAAAKTELAEELG